jgi:hypothetical protein
MSLPIIAARWIEWINKKQPQILRLRLRMTLLRVGDDGAGWVFVGVSSLTLPLP